VSEILALDSTGNRYLTLERTYIQSSAQSGVFSAKLYEVDLAGATPIEKLNAATPTIIPVKKQLVFDFAKLNRAIPNLEAMTWGPVLPNGQRSLVLTSDNNYSASSPTGPRVSSTQVFVLGVDFKLTTISPSPAR
jgi:hypothetical protein